MSDKIERELTSMGPPYQNTTGTLREHIETQTRRLNTIADGLALILVAIVFFGLAISGLLVWVAMKMPAVAKEELEKPTNKTAIKYGAEGVIFIKHTA